MRRFHLASWAALLVAVAVLFPQSVRSRKPEKEWMLDGDPVYRVLPRGAIPAITEPEFVSAEEGERFLRAGEPVLGLVVDGQARAYSLWQLDHHEVVNDSAGGKDFAVTW